MTPSLRLLSHVENIITAQLGDSRFRLSKAAPLLLTSVQLGSQKAKEPHAFSVFICTEGFYEYFPFVPLPEGKFTSHSGSDP